MGRDDSKQTSRAGDVAVWNVAAAAAVGCISILMASGPNPLHRPRAWFLATCNVHARAYIPCYPWNCRATNPSSKARKHFFYCSTGSTMKFQANAPSVVACERSDQNFKSSRKPEDLWSREYEKTITLLTISPSSDNGRKSVSSVTYLPFGAVNGVGSRNGARVVTTRS